MKDTVAIIGSHPATSREFDFDRTDCDIWIFNEALNTDWCKRADGVFQIHKPVIWRSATNRNDPKHYQWLQEQTDSIIYMIDQYDDVPKSERYPLMEIMAAFPTAKKYFTSSVSYAIALAIYKGYDVIEIYGVEMETGTEYGHQRTGVAYWCGFAEGRGIYVDFHSKKFFNAPLYGYEGDVQIPLEFYQKRIDMLKGHIQNSNAAYKNVENMVNEMLNEFIKTYKADLSTLDEKILAMGQNAHNFGMVDGAFQTDQHYLEKCKTMLEETGDYLIVRQEFESYMRKGAKTAQEAYQRVQKAGELLHEKMASLNTNDKREVRERLVADFMGAVNAYVRATTDLGRGNGIARENQLLIKEYDTFLRASGIEPEKSEVEVEPETAEVPA
jgi:hypothetical protein